MVLCESLFVVESILPEGHSLDKSGTHKFLLEISATGSERENHPLDNSVCISRASASSYLPLQVQ